MDAMGYAPLRVTGPEVTRALAAIAALGDASGRADLPHSADRPINLL
jgi:hypothetical protein